MDIHLITRDYVALIYSTDERPMKSHQQIKAERNDKQLNRKPLYACGECHNCGWWVPPRALWCCTSCATDYEAEKQELLARDGK